MSNTDKFVLKGKKLHQTTDSTRTVVRVSQEAYNTLVEMANDSVLPMSKIASQAIMFAYDHLEYDRGEEEE